MRTKPPHLVSMKKLFYMHPLISTSAEAVRFTYNFFAGLVLVSFRLCTGQYSELSGGLFAKVQYGEMIADMRGKINGSVHSRNRAGAYMRNKVTPVNPQTVYQTAVRNRLTGRAQAWRGISQIARDAWNAAVSNFQKTNIFGQLRTPSGINLYNRLNMNLLNIGEAVILEPPLPSSVESLSSVSVVADDSANSVTVTFAPPITAASKIILEATEPLSPGISFAKSQFRQIAVLDSTNTSPYVASANYTAKFGATPVEGSKIFIRLTVVDVASGIAGIPLSASTITVA